MTEEHTGSYLDPARKVIDFAARVEQIKDKRLEAQIAPFARKMSAFAESYQLLHKASTLFGSDMNDLIDELDRQGYPTEDILRVRSYLQGAGAAFENEIVQGGLEACIQHMSEATDALLKTLRAAPKKT